MTRQRDRNQIRSNKSDKIHQTRRRRNLAKLERNTFNYRERFWTPFEIRLAWARHKGVSQRMKTMNLSGRVIRLMSFVGDSIIKAVLKPKNGIIESQSRKNFF